MEIGVRKGRGKRGESKEQSYLAMERVDYNGKEVVKGLVPNALAKTFLVIGLSTEEVQPTSKGTM